ncbi:MAG: adenosylcobinamide-GDP ribazoletransferase, partial [Pseudomonadota bacterium]
AAGIVLTGGLHEDGLADCCDGLGGGATREHALEIMRDSRVGTFGAAALILSIGLRWAVLARFTPDQGLIALVMCHTISRAMIPPVLVSGHYARSRGLASSVAEGVTGLEAAFAMILAFAIAMIAGPVFGLAAFAAAIIAGGLMLSILMYRLGGYTGDGLGAIQQVAEIAILIVLAGVWM